jgi:FkbM family methyltransferase
MLRNRRVLVLLHALRNRSTGGGLGRLLQNAFAPTVRILARRHLAAITPSDGMLEVRLAGRHRPLYLPHDADRYMLNQIVAEQLEPWMWHRYEEPETRVEPGDVVFDCGAAEGLFTLLVHDRARQVVLFEPDEQFAACLARTFAAAENVMVVRSALADREGDRFLSDEGISSHLTDDAAGRPVPVTTIDAYCAASGVVPTYIKADVEGSERAVLAGARNTIREHKPRIAITTYHLPGDHAALRDMLRGLRPDYRVRVKGIEHLWGQPIMLHAW